jgi:hypothetical protein
MEKHGTTASADFCEHESGHPGRPAFRASPTHGYAAQISPDKNVICPRPNATSTCTPSSSSVSRCHARSPGVAGLECDFCTSPGGSWCEDVQRRFFAGLPIIFAGFLPTVCCLAAVALTSCYFLMSYPSGMMTPKEGLEQNTGDFHPTRSRPCWAYMHWSGGLRVS